MKFSDRIKSWMRRPKPDMSGAPPSAEGKKTVLVLSDQVKAHLLQKPATVPVIFLQMSRMYTNQYGQLLPKRLIRQDFQRFLFLLTGVGENPPVDPSRQR